MPIIKLEDISKKYGKKVILEDVNLSFDLNRCYLLLGENGAGKSTLIKIILGLVKPSKGRIICSQMSIGYIPEKYKLADYLSIYNFLIIIGKIRGLKYNELESRIKYLLEFWEISESRDKKMKQLSKGMLQKVIIIQAMLHDPKLIILDEALNGLDPKMQNRFLNLLSEEKQKGKLIIITSHYPKLYEDIVDEVLQIKNRRVDLNENC